MNRRNWLKFATLAAGSSIVSRKLFGDQSPIGFQKSTSHGFTNLSINENQFGPSPKAIEAIHNSATFANEYPMNGQAKLKLAIAQRESVSTEQVILGAGSSDITMGASATFGSSGGNFVSSDPSFAPLMMWAEKFGVEHLKVPWTSNYGVDLDRIESSITKDTKIVYVCNPENPAGTLLDPEVLYDFCKRVSQRCPIMVDEAYIEFAGDPNKLGMMRCVREGMPVIVLRTFSKGYGLGGSRVGYAVCEAELAKRLSDYYVTGIGCGCSHMSLEAALAAYSDQSWLSSVRSKTAEARESLYAVLDETGYKYIPSVTTFVLAKPSKNSKLVSDAIYGGFRIKLSPREYFDQDYLRISLGRPDQMESLFTALRLTA